MTLDFFKTSANLKNIPRQGWINKLNLNNPESVAEHSFSMAIISMVFSDLGKCNSEKIIKMALLHDLAESEIGDYTPEQIKKEEKDKLEHNAFVKIINTLPSNLQEEYLQLWTEYQENFSEESKLVHQIDKLEMALQAKMYEKEGSHKEKTTEFLKSAKDYITNPKLKEILKQIIDSE